MQTEDIIKAGISYIEENLKTDISTTELADMAGYSVWHYQRLFARITGMPVTVYIGKRRLDRALAEIAAGRRAIDVALEYGFDTYSGFYKAFVKVYGRSPKKKLSKAEVSTMFNKRIFSAEELRNILTNWDIQQDLPILDVYIKDGAEVAGNVWSVGEEFILKAGSRENMLKNLKIVKALAEQGFVSSVPIPTRTGADYLEDNKTVPLGRYTVVLARGVKGSPLSKAERFGEKRRDFGFKYGESFARLHRALAIIESDIKPKEQNLYATVTEQVLPDIRKQNEQFGMGLTESFFDDYIKTFGSLFDKLPKQLIHRDPHPANILFDNNEVSGFIDFDFSEKNIRLWDPCYCATGILSEWRDTQEIYQKWPDILTGILHGYDSLNPLSVEEKQAIYYVICSIQMVCITYFESVDELKDLAQTNREILKYIVGKAELIKSLF